MHELFHYSFFYYAVAISVVLSLLFALISFIIVVRKLSFLAIGTEHAAFGGAGLAQLLKTDHFMTTALFCMILTVFSGKIYKKSTDMGVSLLFSGAMALGMIFLSISENSSFNLMGFLFGDILGIGMQELIISLLFLVGIFLVVLPSFKKILFVIFNRDMAQIAGVNVDFWDTVIYIVLSLSVVLGISLVGVLLIAAMTILPAAFALLFQKNVKNTMIISFIFSLLVMISGIVSSFYYDIAPGALIVVIAIVSYFVCKLYFKIKSMYGEQSVSE